MTIVGTPTSTDETAARARIARMVESDLDPVLSSDHLDDLVGLAARPDADDYVRGDAAWTPTWDFNTAAAEGWSRKAGIAASRFNFAEDGQRFDRAQIYQHCESQRLVYANRSMGSIDVSTPS
jgi:hypothetical protein